MVKMITVSLRDHVWNDYLSHYNGNRSAYVEEMFIKGVEVATGDLDSSKQKIVALQLENRNLLEQLNSFKLQVGSLTEKLKKKGKGSLDPEIQRRLQMVNSLKASGVLEDMP